MGVPVRVTVRLLVALAVGVEVAVALGIGVVVAVRVALGAAVALGEGLGVLDAVAEGGTTAKFAVTICTWSIVTVVEGLVGSATFPAQPVKA